MLGACGIPPGGLVSYLLLPFWLIVGMIAGLFNMIPLIGPWVGAVPGIVIAFASVVIATAAAVFERVLQNAVDIKAENDLTV